MKSQLLFVAVALCLSAGVAHADQSPNRRPQPQPREQENYQDRDIDENYYEDDQRQDCGRRCGGGGYGGYIEAPAVVIPVPVPVPVHPIHPGPIFPPVPALPICSMVPTRGGGAVVMAGQIPILTIGPHQRAWIAQIRFELVRGGPQLGPPRCASLY